MTTKKAVSATARWDDDSNPTNAGWVVDVVYADGTQDSGLAPAPKFYNAGPTHYRAQIITETLKWEGIELV